MITLNKIHSCYILPILCLCRLKKKKNLGIISPLSLLVCFSHRFPPRSTYWTRFFSPLINYPAPLALFIQHHPIIKQKQHALILQWSKYPTVLTSGAVQKGTFKCCNFFHSTQFCVQRSGSHFPQITNLSFPAVS